MIEIKNITIKNNSVNLGPIEPDPEGEKAYYIYNNDGTIEAETARNVGLKQYYDYNKSITDAVAKIEYRNEEFFKINAYDGRNGRSMIETDGRTTKTVQYPKTMMVSDPNDYPIFRNIRIELIPGRAVHIELEVDLTDNTKSKLSVSSQREEKEDDIETRAEESDFIWAGEDKEIEEKSVDDSEVIDALKKCRSSARAREKMSNYDNRLADKIRLAFGEGTGALLDLFDELNKQSKEGSSVILTHAVREILKESNTLGEFETHLTTTYSVDGDAGMYDGSSRELPVDVFIEGLSYVLNEYEGDDEGKDTMHISEVPEVCGIRDAVKDILDHEFDNDSESKIDEGEEMEEETNEVESGSVDRYNNPFNNAGDPSPSQEVSAAAPGQEELDQGELENQYEKIQEEMVREISSSESYITLDNADNYLGSIVDDNSADHETTSEVNIMPGYTYGKLKKALNHESSRVKQGSRTTVGRKIGPSTTVGKKIGPMIEELEANQDRDGYNRKLAVVLRTLVVSETLRNSSNLEEAVVKLNGSYFDKREGILYELSGNYRQTMDMENLVKIIDSDPEDSAMIETEDEKIDMLPEAFSIKAYGGKLIQQER